jgi:phage gpG-like protein
MIEIKIDSKVVVAALERLAKASADMTPVMLDISETMYSAVMRNFDEGGRPKWMGLDPKTIESRNKSRHSMANGSLGILQRSGTLRNSIVAEHDANSAVVGVGFGKGAEKYAAIHQFGGKTSPHVIRPKNKKALAFGGIVRKSVNHPGSVIPARPFLALTSEDEGKIVNTVSGYLRNIVG